MDIQQNIVLNDKNTFRIGGSSLFYTEPIEERELKDSFSLAIEKELPVFVLGKGSNVLISDYGWSGLTINTSAHLNKIFWDKECVTVQCGALLNTLVNQSIANGFAGMEELSGIPGTIGGAVVMNAGAYNNCIADTFESASICNHESGECSIVDAKRAALGYRTSIFKGCNEFLMKATFKFTKSKSIEELKSIQRDILALRKTKQPLEYPNCGSVFKRPSGNFAGTLIEKCGLKGLQSGEMQISEKHANFIVNRGNGRAEDVRILIRTAQTRVYEQYGILLEPEVLFVGEFDEPLYNNS